MPVKNVPLRLCTQMSDAFYSSGGKTPGSRRQPLEKVGLILFQSSIRIYFILFCFGSLDVDLSRISLSLKNMLFLTREHLKNLQFKSFDACFVLHNPIRMFGQLSV